MVGKDNSLNTGLVGLHGIFDALDALDYYRKLGEASYPGQDVPINKWGDFTGAGFCYALPRFDAWIPGLKG